MSRTACPLPRGLYAITDSTMLAGRLLGAVEAALEGGAVLVQYRHKAQTGAHQHWPEAEQLLRLCRRHRVPLLINDDVALAAAIGADGVHLGRRDDSIAAARLRLGEQAIIGATCHDSLAFAAEAVQQGASYIAFGAMFASTTKPGAHLAPAACIGAAAPLQRPVVVIGGITVDNAPPLIAAGAHCVAVIHDLWSAPDIRARAQAFAQLFA